MRRAALVLLALGLVGFAIAQPVPPPPPPPPPKAAKEATKEEEFDQKKADQDLVKSAGYDDDLKSLVGFFTSHTVNDADKKKILAHIKQLGDDSYDQREAASEALAKSGVPAIALLRAAMNVKDADPEVWRRSELALQAIEKVPTRALAMAAARLLATKPDESVAPALLAYLPLSDEEAVADEIRTTLASVAVRDGKPDAALTAALASKEAPTRAIAAEAFARNKDKESRGRMKELLTKEPSDDVKLLIALALVGDGRDKGVVPELIRLMGDLPVEKGWRAEELLFRLAGEEAPNVSLGSDKAANAKTRDEWKKWWDANQAKVDLAKLDQESSFGLTIVCETSNRGNVGRIVALGGDMKERWSVDNLNWPMDAVPLSNKRVVIAEHNRNRVVEREIGGKEIWSESMNQPVNVGRLPNGTTWAVGRNQIIEWERGEKSPKKQAFSFNRGEYDIVAGARTKNGEYVVLTQNGQLFQVDRKGVISKTHNVGGNGINYYSSVEVLPNGKVLATLMNEVAEYDMATGKQTWTAKFQFATSATRLRNGNTMVGHQNSGRIQQLDKDGKVTPTEYKSAQAGYRAFRAFRR